jgi:hypothetical protein
MFCIFYGFNPLSHVHLSPRVSSLCKYLYMSSQPLASKGKYFGRDPHFLGFRLFASNPLSAITAPACLSLNISSLCVAYLLTYTELTHAT